ncbi:hypothetical protein [Bartonella sp. OD88NMGDW]|uniref:hypothetical protein n=1 Tax=Bartonella sp. OD88NMGDW TaxID=3243571 RepID=UPI0035CF8ED5
MLGKLEGVVFLGIWEGLEKSSCQKEFSKGNIGEQSSKGRPVESDHQRGRLKGSYQKSGTSGFR